MSVQHRGCQKAGHTDGQPHEDVPYGSGTRPNPLSMALERICEEKRKSLVGSPVFTPAARAMAAAAAAADKPGAAEEIARDVARVARS